MEKARSRCWFCFMRTSMHWMGIPLCSICRDQLYDFVWVSVVQTIVWVVGGIGGLYFIIDEVLLFLVLVVVKHRIPAPWDHP